MYVNKVIGIYVRTKTEPYYAAQCTSPLFLSGNKLSLLETDDGNGDGRVPRWHSAGRRRSERRCRYDEWCADRIFRCMHTFRSIPLWVDSNLASAGASPSGPAGLEGQQKALCDGDDPNMHKRAKLDLCLFLFYIYFSKKRKGHIRYKPYKIPKGTNPNVNESFPILFRWP